MTDTNAPTQDIKIRDYCHGDEPAGVFARGNFGAAEFLSATREYLRAEWDTDMAADQLEGVEERHVEHLFWREEDHGHGKRFVLSQPLEEGAYPVTLIDWERAER